MMIDPRRSLGDDFKCENTIRAQEIFPGTPDQICVAPQPQADVPAVSLEGFCLPRYVCLQQGSLNAA